MQAYLTQEFKLEGFHCTYRITGIQNRNKSRNNKIRSPARAETDFIIPQDRNVRVSKLLLIRPSRYGREKRNAGPKLHWLVW